MPCLRVGLFAFNRTAQKNQANRKKSRHTPLTKANFIGTLVEVFLYEIPEIQSC